MRHTNCAVANVKCGIVDHSSGRGGDGGGGGGSRANIDGFWDDITDGVDWFVIVSRLGFFGRFGIFNLRGLLILRGFSGLAGLFDLGGSRSWSSSGSSSLFFVLVSATERSADAASELDNRVLFLGDRGGGDSCILC